MRRTACSHPAPSDFARVPCPWRAGLNSFYAQNWTSALGYAETQEWRPWTIDGKEAMGGYITRYEHDFDYLTIRGAGHMVPEYQARRYT